MNNEKEDKTTSKPHRVGPETGVKFSAENQPTPEAKKKGWEKIRKDKLLTQEVVKMMFGDDGKPTKTFKGFMEKVVENANKGNSKALEILSKCIEDDIQKSETVTIVYTAEVTPQEARKISDDLESEV